MVAGFANASKKLATCCPDMGLDRIRSIGSAVVSLWLLYAYISGYAPRNVAARMLA